MKENIQQMLAEANRGISHELREEDYTAISNAWERKQRAAVLDEIERIKKPRGRKVPHEI
jgi:hypothetical protein